jgi:cytochrome c-type biogenesis protein CcsB
MSSVLLAQWSELFMLLAALTYVSAFALFTIDLVRRGRDRPDADGRASGKGREGGPARAAGFVTTYAFILHLAALAARGLAAGHAPWDNLYGFVTTSALILTGVFLLAMRWRDLRFAGAPVTGVVIVVIAAASIAFDVPIVPLPPALQSGWILIHTVVAMGGTALFALSFCLSVLQLLQHRRRARDGRGPRFLRSVPSAEQLQVIVVRCTIVAFVLWTGAVIFGALWAHDAWGRYWGWDVKEVWAFIIWVTYAGYLHARVTREWQGPRMAWLNVIAFGTVIFNSTVVNLSFTGLHSYAGLLD